MKAIIYISSLLIIITLGCNREQIRDYSNRTSYFKNTSTGYQSNTAIRCVTFNIHLGFDATQDPWNKDISGAGMDQVKNIAQILRQIDPDIIALQEVHRNRYNAIVKALLEALAAELEMNYAFGAHGYNDPYGLTPVDGEWGNAILTRFEIESIANQETEYRSVWERRSMIDAVLKINDSTKLHALSLHWLPSDQAIQNTTSYLETIHEPIILMGDFNYNGLIQEFNDIGLSDVDSNYIYHGIDRTFIDRSIFGVQELGTLVDTNLTSDHPANYSILKMK